jgi:hypothetical protein
VPRSTRADIKELLAGAGASLDETEAIICALEDAGLNPPAMRRWLMHPHGSYSLDIGRKLLDVPWLAAPIEAVALGHSTAVVAAAETFAAASPDERFISRACACNLESVRRLTHDDPGRTAKVREIVQILLNRLRKDQAVDEALQTTLSGDFVDTTRLVDWMLDDRLDYALESLRDGTTDPVALRERGPMFYVGW